MAKSRIAAAFILAQIAGGTQALEANPKAVAAFEQGEYALCHITAARSGISQANRYWTVRCGGEARIRNEDCGRNCGRRARGALQSLQVPGGRGKRSYHQWLVTSTPGAAPAPTLEALVQAVARAESNLNPRARSRAGALGYMQVMPATARAILPAHWPKRRVRRCLFNQDCNRRVGTAYLKEQLRNKDRNLVRALYAYNAGPKNERRWWAGARQRNPVAAIDRIPIRETRNYVRRVLRNLWNDRAGQGQHPGRSLLALKADQWPDAP